MSEVSVLTLCIAKESVTDRPFSSKKGMSFESSPALAHFQEIQTSADVQGHRTHEHVYDQRIPADPSSHYDAPSIL